MAKKRKMKELFKGFKRLSDAEKLKAEQRKLQRKANKPKGYGFRKLGIFTFWALFLSMFGFMLLLLIGNGNAKDEDDGLVPYSKITSQEAVIFAQNFSKAYFTWTPQEVDIINRQVKLANYLAVGLDVNAGLQVNELTWASTYQSSQVVDVKQLDENLGQVTLKVNTALTKGEEKKSATRYLAVPIAYDGSTFGVYQLPQFVEWEEKTTVKQVVANDLKSADTQSTKDIRSFIDTFFQIFVMGGDDQLHYLVESKQAISGLNGSMDFKEVKKAEIYLDEATGHYIAFVEVHLIDPAIETTIVSNYQLTIKKKEEQYALVGMNDLTNQQIKSKSQDEMASELQEQTAKLEAAKQKAEQASAKETE